MVVGVVTVGDELLNGTTENTNATWLAKQLTQRGATVRRIVVVPDVRSEIQSIVRKMSERWDAVLLTGGLGPTHDDVTMAALADAFERDLQVHPEAEQYFQRETDYDLEDLLEGTTSLPAGADFLPNPAGVAPGARIENVYVLPGVPEEMKAMFELIAPEFDGPQSKTAVITTDCPESDLVDVLSAAAERFDVRIGSYPNDVLTIRITGKDEAVVEAAQAWLDAHL
ncbi:MAG: competence/damage-inducible protein A [Halodesulfurarchaeum sp.]